MSITTIPSTRRSIMRSASTSSMPPTADANAWRSRSAQNRRANSCARSFRRWKAASRSTPRRPPHRPPAQLKHRPADHDYPDRLFLVVAAATALAIPQVAQQCADDVRIVVSPHPLARVALTDRPEFRLGQDAEVRLVAGDRSDGRDPAMLVDVLVDVAAVVDADDGADRFTDPGYH